VFYHNDELSEDTSNGEVHVFPMTTTDELMFRTPDLLFSGKAIENVLTHCIPQVKKPMELLIKDMDYLLTCLRLVTYGPTMSVNYEHTCENAKLHQYEVALQPLIKQARAIDPTTLTTAYAVSLDNGQVVKMRPMVFKTGLELNQSADYKDKLPSFDETKRSMLTVIADIIDNVDGISDRQMIAEWVDKAPAGFVRKIIEAVGTTSDWGVDFTVKKNCQDCKEEISITIGTNPVMLFS
jgi:hypothetical protein